MSETKSQRKTLDERKIEWKKDQRTVKESRKKTIKKIKEWEKEEGKNINGEQSDEKVNFEIITELKNSDESLFSNLLDEWQKIQWEEVDWEEVDWEEADWTKKETPKKDIGLELWKRFWNHPEELWEKNPELFSWCVERIKNLKNFSALKTTWNKRNNKNLDYYFPHPDWLVKETTDSPSMAKKKEFGDWMTAFAVGGLAFLGVMIILAAVCSTSCGTEQVILEDGTIKDHAVNIPLRILESQLMIVFISTVIGPVVVRILKEKYDIQIEVSQFNMIMQDAINAVKMYNKEANELRDKNGKLDEVSQRKLRNLAFASIANNYDMKKYNELIKNVGVQIFEKAIENAVTSDKLERLPLEREKIKEIISQAIDAVPQIVEWQKTDNEAKKVFLDGHVRRLLATIGVEGWAHKQLENIFDAEVSNRLLAAAIADKNELLKAIKNKDEYLLYTSTVLSAVSDSLAKSTENKSNTKS